MIKLTVSVDTLINRSVARIGDVHPSLKEYAIELIRRCYKEGILVQLSSGYRSFIDQAYIYGQGRYSYKFKGKEYGRLKDANGKTLPIISNAEPGESIHNYGLAIDYFLVSEDGNNSIWTVNSDWKRVAAIAKSMGFEWGGDWSSFRDYPHLQYTKGLTLGQIAKGLRPAFPKLITEEVKTASKPVLTKGVFRVKTGTFPNARGLANAIDRVEVDFGWVTYELADSLTFNPSYRIVTGTFTTKESAEKARKQMKEKYGWVTYLVDETPK